MLKNYLHIRAIVIAIKGALHVILYHVAKSIDIRRGDIRLAFIGSMYSFLMR